MHKADLIISTIQDAQMFKGVDTLKRLKYCHCRLVAKRFFNRQLALAAKEIIGERTDLNCLSTRMYL